MSRCPTCGETFSAGQFCPKDGAQLEPEPEPEIAVGGEAEEDPLVGQVVADRFRLVSRLGSGGMGTVYVAEHLFIKKRVALKLLRPEVTTNPEAMARFQREALAASTIGHENIVAIDDCGHLPDGQIYLTMELLAGESLSQLMGRRQLTLSEALHIAIQTCHGLGAAHTKGIIHRDMKPDNILLVGEPLTVKILDFGIAKIVRAGNNTNLTKTGTVFGTPNYMAPEQALGRQVDHRADIYSMGVILYQMLTGRLPFCADSFVAVLTQHVTQAPEPLRQVAPQRGISAATEQLVLKAMAKDPEQRFQDMRQLIDALLQLRGDNAGDFSLASHLHLSQLGPPLADESQPPPRPHPHPHPHPSSAPTALAGELIDVSRARSGRRWRGLTPWLLLALIMGAGVIAFWVRPFKTELALRARPPVIAAEADRRGAVDAVAPRSASAAAAGVPASGPAAGFAAPGPAAVARIILETIPSGATVWRGDERVGQTPELFEVEVGQQLMLELRKPGYLDQKLDFRASSDAKKIVRLERRRVSRGRKATTGANEGRRDGRGGDGGQTSGRRPRPTPAPDRVSDHDLERSNHDEVIEPY